MHSKTVMQTKPENKKPDTQLKLFLYIFHLKKPKLYLISNSPGHDIKLCFIYFYLFIFCF